MAGVTEAELLQQVQKALDAPTLKDGAMSVVELSEELDMSASAVRKRLKKMLAAGTVEVVYVKRRAMHGVISKRVAYKLIKKVNNEN